MEPSGQDGTASLWGYPTKNASLKREWPSMGELGSSSPMNAAIRGISTLVLLRIFSWLFMQGTVINHTLAYPKHDYYNPQARFGF